MTATQADPKDTPAKEPAPSPWAAARLLREAATGEGPQLRQAMLWLCLAAGVEAAGSTDILLESLSDPAVVSDKASDGKGSSWSGGYGTKR